MKNEINNKNFAIQLKMIFEIRKIFKYFPKCVNI